MEYFVISAKFVPLKYYTLSSQLRRLTSFSVGCSGRRILSPGQITVMRKWSILSKKLIKRQKIAHPVSYPNDQCILILLSFEYAMLGAVHYAWCSIAFDE